MSKPMTMLSSSRINPAATPPKKTASSPSVRSRMTAPTKPQTSSATPLHPMTKSTNA